MDNSERFGSLMCILLLAGCGDNTPANSPDSGRVECLEGSFDDDGRAQTPCVEWTECEPGQFIETQGTATSDQSCAECLSDTWDHDGDPATVCVERSACVSGQFTEVEGDSLEDRTCGDCTEIVNCGSGLICTSVDDQTCGACITDYVLQPDSGLCELPWPRIVGTIGDDVTNGAAIDSEGSVFVAGRTNDSLEGTSAGSMDAFVRKYSSDGLIMWTRQLGQPGYDTANSLAVDVAGNAFVSGFTSGDIEGVSAGNNDIFVRKFDSAGSTLWTRQFGSPETDVGTSTAVDNTGAVYIVGYTRGGIDGVSLGSFDGFVRKYSGDGVAEWTRQVGTNNYDLAQGVVTDSNGDIYIVGKTRGRMGTAQFGQDDAFVQKLDNNGAVLWNRQFGTSSADEATSVAVGPQGNIYVAGLTTGVLGAASLGQRDAFIRKLGADGTEIWTRQFGTDAIDIGNSLAVSPSGDIYVTGSTTGAFSGVNAGGTDFFATVYSSDGTLIETTQIGTISDDSGKGVVVDSNGNAYAAGVTGGMWPQQIAVGQDDSFIVRLTP